MQNRPTPKSKVLSLSEAVSRVPDGAYVVLGGVALHMHPMSFVRELVRQGKKDLTVLGEIQGIEVDLLAGGGALARVESAGVGLEGYGLARNYRRAVEAGEVEMVDYTDTMSMDRILARAENLTFWPVCFLGGTDIARHIPDLVPFTCPVTGRELLAMPAARVDIAVLHMPAADERGNVVLGSRPLLPQAVDLIYGRAANRLFVTVEQLVGSDFTRRHSHLTKIPAFQVEAVIEAPCGAHPGSMPDFYEIDTAHMEAYVDASRSPEAFAAYLREYVLEPRNETEYLSRVGVRNLLAARRGSVA